MTKKKDIIEENRQKDEIDDDLTKEEAEEAKPVSEETGEDQKPDSLAEGVTLAPRNEEEMHMSLIKHSPPLVETYLAVSDDKGELQGDTSLEEEVKGFCERNKNVHTEKIENPKLLLEEVKELTNRYALQINKTESVTGGKITKYRIREGMLYNIERAIVRKMGQNWIDWYVANHDAMSLRSAQDYMALAKVPNITRYAFLGKENLMEILRAVKGSKDEDPMGKYLKDHGVPFDPESPQPDLTDRMRFEVDAVIAMIRISTVEQKREVDLDVNYELIRNLIGLGTKIETGIIRDLVTIKENGGDVNQYLERRYISGGGEEEIITSTRKLTSIPKLVANFRSAVAYIREHTDLASQISLSEIDDLENQISQLKELIVNN